MDSVLKDNEVFFEYTHRLVQRGLNRALLACVRVVVMCAPHLRVDVHLHALCGANFLICQSSCTLLFPATATPEEDDERLYAESKRVLESTTVLQLMVKTQVTLTESNSKLTWQAVDMSPELQPARLRRTAAVEATLASLVGHAPGHRLSVADVPSNDFFEKVSLIRLGEKSGFLTIVDTSNSDPLPAPPANGRAP